MFLNSRVMSRILQVINRQITLETYHQQMSAFVGRTKKIEKERLQIISDISIKQPDQLTNNQMLVYEKDLESQSKKLEELDNCNASVYLI